MTKVTIDLPDNIISWLQKADDNLGQAIISLVEDRINHHAYHGDSARTVYKSVRLAALFYAQEHNLLENLSCAHLATIFDVNRTTIWRDLQLLDDVSLATNRLLTHTKLPDQERQKNDN